MPESFDGKCFAERLQSLRHKLGLSQMEFANQCGMNQGHYGLLEMGKREPNLKTMIKIADGLGIPLSELVKSDQLNINVHDDLSINRVVAYMVSLPPGVREDVADMMKLFMKSRDH